VTKFAGTAWRSVLTSLLALGMASGIVSAQDLSRYRDFQLGTDLPTITKQIGTSPAQIKVIDRRPALIQEMAWHPQPLGSSHKTESVQEVVLTFYDGELFRIVVNYDRHETEGLTTADLVGAISTTYGLAAKPSVQAKAMKGPYGDPEDMLAQWQDSQYRFDLIRSSYGPSFRLIGVLKRLEAPAQAAMLEAQRLDDQEAPQRDAARIASEEDVAKAKLEKARLVNKLKFRP
jgi:hypothetical protein